jgi:hypothetical protein
MNKLAVAMTPNHADEEISIETRALLDLLTSCGTPQLDQEIWADGNGPQVVAHAACASTQRLRWAAERQTEFRGNDLAGSNIGLLGASSTARALINLAEAARPPRPDERSWISWTGFWPDATDARRGHEVAAPEESVGERSCDPPAIRESTGRRTPPASGRKQVADGGAGRVRGRSRATYGRIYLAAQQAWLARRQASPDRRRALDPRRCVPHAQRG